MEPARRDPLLGAIGLPPLVTALLLATGHDVVRFGLNGFSTGIYLAGLATAGAVVGYAARRSREGARPHLLVVAGVAGYVLLTSFDPLFAPPPDEYAAVLDYAADALFLGVASTVVVVAAEAAANPARAAAAVPPDARRPTLAAAVGHALLALVVRTGVFDFPAFGRGLFGIGLGLWLLGGAAVEGAAVALAYARFRLATPALALAAAFCLTAWETWEAVSSPAALAAAITPFTLYLAAWFAVVPAVLFVGLVEYGVRHAADVPG